MANVILENWVFTERKVPIQNATIIVRRSDTGVQVDTTTSDVNGHWGPRTVDITGWGAGVYPDVEVQFNSQVRIDKGGAQVFLANLNTMGAVNVISGGINVTGDSTITGTLSGITLLSFPLTLGDKQYLYTVGAGSNYGLGMNTGEMVLFPAGAQTLTMRDSNYNGTLGFSFSPLYPTMVVGPVASAASFGSGTIRLANGHRIAWRSGGGASDVVFGIDTSDRLLLNGLIAINSTATAGSNTLPSNPYGFVRVMMDGVERRIPVYNA